MLAASLAQSSAFRSNRAHPAGRRIVAPGLHGQAAWESRLILGVWTAKLLNAAPAGNCAPKLACVWRAAFAPRVVRRLVLVFTLVAAGIARAADPSRPVTLTGKSSSFDLDTGEMVLLGGAQLRQEGLLLQADEIRSNISTKVSTAVGNVVFTRGAIRLLADRLIYQGGNGSFTAQNIRLGSYPVYAAGISASGTPTEITVEQARVFFGEPGPWQPTFNADRITYGPGRHVRSENARMGIGDVQPVPFPKFQHNLAEPLAFALTLNGGFRSSLGAFVEGGGSVPVTPVLRVGADLGIYTSRGLLAGPAGRYADPDEPEQLHGSFRTGYINDHGNKTTDILNRPVPEDRGFVEWQHEQILADHLTLRAQLNWWKDSEVLRDFRPRSFFPVQQPDTFVESVYTGANYYLSAFARLRPNSFQRVQERLPEVRFDLLPVALGNGFYARGNASAAVLREDPLPATGGTPPAALPSYPLSGDAPWRSDRLDAYYALMRPFALHDWFDFTPIAGARVTHYANTTGAVSPGGYTRWLGEAGADAALRASGTFDYQNPQWKINGLRHLITPRLSYRFIPEAENGRAQIPRIDRDVFSNYLPLLGLGDVRNIDDLHATSTLRLAVENTLQTRDAVEGTRDLLLLNVADDFRFRRQPGERDVSEIHTELALLPARWLQVDLYQSFAPQTFTLREFNAGVTLRDGTAWSLRFANNFLRHQIQDYVFDGRVRINEAFAALSRLHYDVRKHRFNEQAYGLVQNLSNTWLISYTVSLYSGPRRESRFGFNVQIDTVRF